MVDPQFVPEEKSGFRQFAEVIRRERPKLLRSVVGGGDVKKLLRVCGYRPEANPSFCV
jgi:hypothetical protein